MFLLRKITLILLTFTIVGCMNKSPEKFEYKVLTVQDIETSLYSKLMKAGAASPVEGQPGKLRITDINQAKSENSMPVVLNNEGSEGWELTTINNSQLYIFQRPFGQKSYDKWQYKVLTIADIDKLIFSSLEADKAAMPIPNQPGKYKILDVEKAKSQVIMAKILGDLGKEGWALAAVNKSDLYIFKKPGSGATEFKQVSKATASTVSEAAKTKEVKPEEGASAAGTKTDSKSDTGTDPKVDATTDSKSNTGTDPKADATTDSKTDTGTDPKADATTDSKTDTGTDPKADATTDSKADTETDPKADATTDSKTDTGTDSKSDTNADKKEADKTAKDTKADKKKADKKAKDTKADKKKADKKK